MKINQNHNNYKQNPSFRALTWGKKGIDNVSKKLITDLTPGLEKIGKIIDLEMTYVSANMVKFCMLSLDGKTYLNPKIIRPMATEKRPVGPLSADKIISRIHETAQNILDLNKKEKY